MVGGKSAIGAVAVVFIGAVVCNAAAVAGDNLQDLKVGQLIGATPWRQQVMLGVGVLASAAVMAPVMNVLLFAYGIGEPAHAGVKALPAPQANLVKSVAEGMFGGTLPFAMIALGAAIGVLIILLDLYLEAPWIALERTGTRGGRGHLSAAGCLHARTGRRHRRRDGGPFSSQTA